MADTDHARRLRYIDRRRDRQDPFGSSLSISSTSLLIGFKGTSVGS